ncbi:MAG: hypothetical protein K9H14_00565 [Actinomycetia bacterium]|nr:hypothetical protein [Actinomycetes bacterium]
MKKYLYKFLSLFHFLSSQKGEVILTYLAVTGIVVLAAGLFSFGGKAMETKKKVEDYTQNVQNYGDIGYDGDANKTAESYKAEINKIYLEGGKTAATTYDETGLLTGIDSLTNTFKTKPKKNDDQQGDKDEEEIIEQKLKEQGVDTDELKKDIALAINKIAKRKSTSDTTDEKISDITVGIIINMENKGDNTKDQNAPEDEKKDGQIEEDKDTKDTEKEQAKDERITIILNTITSTLNANKKLEADEIVGQKKELDKKTLEKKYLEDKINSYKYFEEQGYIVTDTTGLSNLKTRLDEVNAEIEGLEKEIENLENKKEIEKDQEEAEEENEEDQEEDLAEAPTIKLKIVEGPTFSEEDKVCYYKVSAETTGIPEPEISFSKDDSNGAWGSNKVQINLKNNNSYTLTATASNSEGSSSDSIALTWGCQEVLSGTVNLKGSGVLTGVADRSTYPINLNINLDTGNVSGSSSFSGTAYGCPFNATISFSGTLNLSTYNLKITANLISRWTGSCSQNDNSYHKTTLSGKLNESATYASGTDSDGGSWSVSR